MSTYQRIDKYIRQTLPGDYLNVFSLSATSPDAMVVAARSSMSKAGFDQCVLLEYSERNLPKDSILLLSDTFSSVSSDIEDIMEECYKGCNAVVQVAPNICFVSVLVRPEGEYKSRVGHYLALIPFPSESAEAMRARLVEYLSGAAKREMARIRFKESTSDDNVILPGSIWTPLTTEVDAFISGRQQYADIGLPWKRGIVLYGPPGNGKSSIIRYLANKYDLLAYDLTKNIGPDGSLELPTVSAVASTEGYGKSLRRYESHLTAHDMARVAFPDLQKPSLYFIEDLDKVLPSSTDDSPKVRLASLLNAIDGVDRIDGALFVATTNHPDATSEALLSRPGRFDSIYEIPNPGQDEIRRMLAKHKVRVAGKDPDRIVAALNGYSMAFVEEYVKVAKILHKTTDLTEEQVQPILDKIHDHREKFKRHFKAAASGIGFGS